jgi:tRNA pseudouridine38-40 synthase
LRRTSWYLGQRKDGRELDLEAMRGAAGVLLGYHDFHAFRAADDDRENTTRTLTRVEIIDGWAGEPRLLAFEVDGNAFMKNMVRIIAGTLVAVGRGALDARDVQTLLGPNGRREHAGPTAPAYGLTLVTTRLGRSR